MLVVEGAKAGAVQLVVLVERDVAEVGAVLVVVVVVVEVGAVVVDGEVLVLVVV